MAVEFASKITKLNHKGFVSLSKDGERLICQLCGKQNKDIDNTSDTTSSARKCGSFSSFRSFKRHFKSHGLLCGCGKQFLFSMYEHDSKALASAIVLHKEEESCKTKMW